MPLFGKKIFASAKPLSNKQPNETIYTIVHTKEQFRTKKEYEKRMAMYKERIWTCRCTGHVNLTHEEALNSEKRVIKALKTQFLPCFEKSVLQLVHHSTIPLETLVDQAWLKLQQVLCVGEKVILKVKAAGRVIKGTIIKVDTAGLEVNPTSNCSSASSDKENSEEEGNSPKKWVPPKLLPYKYSFRLDGEDKIINAVPASDLQRVEKPPAKELLRLFIRTHSIRSGQNSTSPWVVDEDKVKEYSLPSKFADFLLSPVKIADVAKKAEEEKAKKRKSKSSHESSSAKKAKLDKSDSKSKDNKKQITLTGSPLKKKVSSHMKSPSKAHTPKKDSPKKKLQNGVIDISSSSSDDSDDEDKPLSKLKSDDEKPLSKLSGKSSSKSSLLKQKSDSPLKKKDKKKHKDKKEKLQSLKQKDKNKRKQKEKSKKNKSVCDSDDEQPLANLKKSPSKKSMKQMTLFELSKKKSLSTPVKKKSISDMRTPEKSTKLNSPPKTPAIVSKLVKAFKQNDQNKVKALAFQAAKMLTSPQRKRLPKDVKELVVKRFEILEEKRKMASMSEAEKTEYMKKKKMEAKKKLQEKQRELRKKYEDQDLDLKPLPQPKLVPTPEGLPNELFGDIAMVTEFVSCYSGLLMPDDEHPIYTDSLMKAICNGKEGFGYLGRVLVVLLQTLLQDQISEDYQEMKVPLNDIPVNSYTASELVRLCLRGHDADDQADDSSDVSGEEEVSEDIIQQLENLELFQLDPNQKVQILKGLCLRIMGTYSVQDFMEEKQQQSSELWKRKLKELKEKNDELKKVKQMKKEEAEAEKNKPKEEETKTEDDKNVLITHFYGKSAPDQESESSKPATPNPQSTEEAESDDLASVVRRRRVMSAKAAAEKEKKDREEKIRREKEFEEIKKQREKELFEKSFTEGIALAKAVLRLTPIGTDRHHNRYWIFSNTTPGLYIEKGWVGPYVEHCPGDSSSRKDESDSSFDDESEDTESTPDGSENKTKQTEKTVPKEGQNLWFTYDTTKDLDGLIQNLHSQGIREGNLKVELQKRYSDVQKAINKANKTNSEPQSSDGDQEITDTFKKQTDLEEFDHHLRKELFETEVRLRNGGLGGVEDFETWEKCLETSTEISTLAKCMLQTQECVVERFRQGIMGQRRKKSNAKEEEEEEIKPEEDNRALQGITRWRESVENCPTLSRLHVLLGILDASIKWEKSQENAKCKICRRKGDGIHDSTLLLCDECNQAFHMQCLRPALYFIPEGDWLCPACAPHEPRRQTRNLVKSYSSESEESSSEESEESDEEKECVECGVIEEDLACCAQCRGAYHLECHDPPLRRPPRGQWICNDCKNGGRRKKKESKQTVQVKRTRGGGKRKKYTEISSDEDEEESDSSEEQDSDEEEEEPTSKSQRQSAQHTTARRGKAAVGRPSATSRGHEESKKGRGSTGQDRKSTDIYADNKPSSRRAPSDLSICEQVVANTMKNKSCWPFLQPVDKKQVPDYYQIIKHPLDFQIIKDRLQCLVYGSVQEVLEDVKIVFNNAEIYNKEGSEILECMKVTEGYFSAQMMKHLPAFPYSRDPVSNGYVDSDSSPTAGKKQSCR